MFEKFDWQSDHLRLGELLFRLEHFRNKDWAHGHRYFSLYKVKELFDQYENYFAAKANFQAKNIIELGIWDGGSLAIWSELFFPSKLIGIDFKSDRGDSDYFKHYIESRKLADKVRTYWGTDQGDRRALNEIVEREFKDPLDLVIDDASHLYGPTKNSFEVLFPKMREGGVYIIEDWAWLHWPEFNDDPYFANQIGLTKLVIELTEMIGSARGIPPAILTVLPGFIAVEKTALDLNEGKPFRIEDYICRRPTSKFGPPQIVRSLG